ncbi:MAG: crossover junction endodeoxyribonuclease RuvC [Acidobacteriota bacterium]
MTCSTSGPTSTSTNRKSLKAERNAVSPCERILGIDPGSTATGWGVLERRGRAWRVAGHGVLRASAREELPARLRSLHEKLSDLLDLWQPGEAAVEDLFHARNARTTLTLGHARGVILLALSQHGLSPISYAALTVKQAITGSGSAEKIQVKQWLCRWLEIRPEGLSTDASDALAVALCHARSRTWPQPRAPSKPLVRAGVRRS